MKVAFLLGSLNRGGTETLLLDCFRHHSSAPFDFIGIYRKEGQLSDDFRATDVPLFHLRPKHRLDVGYFFRLRNLIRARQIEILHAHQPLDALFARFASLLMPVRIVLTLHGYDNNFKAMDRFILRQAMQASDLILCVSNVQKTYYQQRYSFAAHKIQLLYNGIAFEKLDHAPETDIRQEFLFPNDVLLLGSVGNFVTGRDQMTLCRFLKKLHEAKVDFRFLFVGAKSAAEPYLFDACVHYCKENDLTSKVFFLGSRQDVPSILKQLDAFLYASDHDTFGIAVMEAMASAVPVFVNDWDVMREITNDGLFATLYPTKNEEALWRLFDDFLKKKEPYQQKAMLAASWVRKQFSIEHFLDELHSIYEN